MQQKTPHKRGFDVGATRAAQNRKVPQQKLVTDNTHKLAIFRALFLKPDLTILFREQSVVPSNANVDTCVKARATLPYQDVSSDRFLSTEHFYAQPFGLRIAAVSATAACFFMCHCSVPSKK
jgi:hypothetical protein